MRVRWDWCSRCGGCGCCAGAVGVCGCRENGVPIELFWRIDGFVAIGVEGGIEVTFASEEG